MSGDAVAVVVERADPGCADALALIDALSDTLTALTGASGRASFEPADVRGAEYQRLAMMIQANGNGLLGCAIADPTRVDDD